MSYYYDIARDLNEYPDAIIYITVGGRNTGKTYSSLVHCMQSKQKFVFVKRTMEDVKLLCAGQGRIGNKVSEFGLDLSPFKAINRDFGSNIRAFQVDNGLGGFWHCDSENQPVGDPIGYLIALSAVQKFKGFDLSDCDYIIFDEFIPQKWERVNKQEGEQLFDLYKTVGRDREHRGKEALKLICLANATRVSNPVMNVLEVTDIAVDMQLHGLEYYYSPDRGIVLHLLKDSAEFLKKEAQSKVYKAMEGTQWAEMALDNKFGYDDFTNVGKISLKHYAPLAEVKFKRKFYYIYSKDGMYYMSSSRTNKVFNKYNLNLENDQKRFFIELLGDLKMSCIEGRMIFETYTMYDLIVNYKQFFKI